jgi:8-oxo-dGTP diphosphatase
MTLRKLSTNILRQHKGISFVGISTCFFVYDGKGKFFMSKRSKNTRDEQGRWEIGGGGLKWGENAEDNMVRELKEEYNAEPLKITFLGYRDIHRKLKDDTPTHWVGLDFAVLVDPSTVEISEPDMIEDSGWFTLDKLPSPLHSQQQIFMHKYKDELESLIH